MCSDRGDWTCLQPGCPIRKPSDQGLVIGSPRLIADSCVLLRFLVPRHPPCALTNLTTKMLASTVQFSRYGRPLVPTGACRDVRRFAGLRGPDRLCPTAGLLSSDRAARALRAQQRARRRRPSLPCSTVTRAGWPVLKGEAKRRRRLTDVPPMSSPRRRSPAWELTAEAVGAP